MEGVGAGIVHSISHTPPHFVENHAQQVYVNPWQVKPHWITQLSFAELTSGCVSLRMVGWNLWRARSYGVVDTRTFVLACTITQAVVHRQVTDTASQRVPTNQNQKHEHKHKGTKTPCFCIHIVLFVAITWPQIQRMLQ